MKLNTKHCFHCACSTRDCSTLAWFFFVGLRLWLWKEWSRWGEVQRIDTKQPEYKQNSMIKKADSKDDGMMGKQCALQYIPSSLPSSGERPAKVVSPHNCTALIFLCGTNQSSNILLVRMHGQKWLQRKTKTKRLKMNGLLNGQFVRRLFFRLLLHSPCDAVVCYEK